MRSISAVVAVRGGPASKTRLAAVMSVPDREALVSSLLANVLRALAESAVRRILVVTPTRRFADQAVAAGADVARDEGDGVNAAFACGLRLIRGDHGLALLMPADLPDVRAHDIAALTQAAAVDLVVAAPTADGGTSALLFATGSGYRPCFGDASFAAHRRAAADARLGFRPVVTSGLAYDLDRSNDLNRPGWPHPAHLAGEPFDPMATLR